MESFEWITEAARFAAIAREWDWLAAEGPTPFLLSAWLLAWWRTVAAPEGLRIPVLWRDGRVVAGLPLHDGPRLWEAPVAHGTPPFFGMLAADQPARERLAAEIVAHAPDEVRLHALLADDPALDSLVRTASGSGARAVVEHIPSTLVIDTSGAFEEYRRGLSSKVRSEIGRLKRKAAREHHLEVTALAVPHDLESQWARALAIEAAGWKGRNGGALLYRPPMAAFFSEFTREFHSAGALRLSELSLDGEVVAVAMSVIHRGRCFTLKVAYDETHRRLGPGFILLMAMIERCFELGLDAYEFSGAEEEYERRFATRRRDRRLLRLYGSGMRGRSRFVYRERLRPVARAGVRLVRPRRRTAPATQPPREPAGAGP
jgi:CelD/BcsL family acetyltransferase involved in cellulose biosynthesis